MQDYITKDQLRALGLQLSDEELDQMISHLNDTVEERIGAEITDSLTDEDLAEFVKLQESASDEELGTWIAAHIPDYVEIVQDNIDIVLGELVESTESINESSDK